MLGWAGMRDLPCAVLPVHGAVPGAVVETPDVPVPCERGGTGVGLWGGGTWGGVWVGVGGAEGVWGGGLRLGLDRVSRR